VLWLWTPQFFLNKCLLFTVYNKVKIDTVYRKGKISIVLNNSLYEPIFFKLFIILKIFSCILIILILLWVLLQKNYDVGYNRIYVRKI